MEVDHIIYAEVRIGKKWFGLNPRVKDFSTGELHVFPIADGKSVLYEAHDRIVDTAFSVPGLPDDLSEELTQVLKTDSKDVIDELGRAITHREWLNRNCFWAKYDMTVRDVVRHAREHKYKGYVFKNTLSEIEDGGAEDFFWMDQTEYDQLSTEEKHEYTYYEWENTSTWYQQFVRIYEQVEIMLQWIRENAYTLAKDSSVPYGEASTVGPGDVRLILLRF